MRIVAMFIFWWCACSVSAHAQGSKPDSKLEANEEYHEPKLPLLSVITDIPWVSWETLKYSFSKESIPAWATIIGTTVVLYHYDDDLFQGARADGRRWGIGNDDYTKTAVSGFGFDLIRLPSDAG